MLLYMYVYQLNYVNINLQKELLEQISYVRVKIDKVYAYKQTY